MSNRYEEKSKKGHGCIGTIIAFVLVVAVCVTLLAFSTDVFDGLKDRVSAFFYPQKYSEFVEKYAEEYGVEESLVYAVIRTESGFHEDAESSVGAKGLMQLMPETFSWLQEKLGDEPMNEDALLNPEINIKYGTFYLSLLLSAYNDNPKTAVAAYNAGTTVVDKWLSDTTYSDDGLTLKDIPYEETKRHVARVMQAKSVYEKLYYGKK
ncbi:MAG: lytic transglycosylase domain-containing protein [Oscillospiraceae bacterium]|nr:lytic transglycosylase domain-containing protein [Candidatus Ruminococcus equi]